ncbi:FmdB family zinc ribbon protein [Pleomorphochaeta sp. DL1XJH-081]|jgi:putative FmdB family regulatory protein|uniref:FmdB family zinc ribbon protein n=1 Tax=Pleomorphochaeta sp. DL1XJH-081 TaxID=3409690 RepID=UPI003BB74105
MPIYEYICDSCNHQFEIQQSMNDNALTECPQCSGKIRRVFGLNSVIFKGSGFYCNDSKKSSSDKASGESSSCASCAAASGTSS